MSDTARSSSRYSANDVVATYDTAEEARAAMTMLERHGVDGSLIELSGPGVETEAPLVNDELREVDLEAAGSLGRRFTAVSFVVAVAGGGLGALLGYVIANETSGLVVGAIGGFIVGGLLGFLYGGYTGLTTNPQWEDTFVDSHGEVAVAVHAQDPDAAESAIQALKGTDARKLSRAGADGTLRDVA